MLSTVLTSEGQARLLGLRVFWPRATARTPLERGSLARGIVGAALAMMVLLTGYGAGSTKTTSTEVAATSAGNADQLMALANHLRESGAVFYGAYWCPHCQNQKAMFGAASRLPYVECDLRGTNGQPAACQAAGVQAYPTWVIGGQRIEGELPISELARRSGFSR